MLEFAMFEVPSIKGIRFCHLYNCATSSHLSWLSHYHYHCINAPGVVIACVELKMKANSTDIVASAKLGQNTGGGTKWWFHRSPTSSEATWRKVVRMSVSVQIAEWHEAHERVRLDTPEIEAVYLIRYSRANVLKSLIIPRPRSWINWMKWVLKAPEGRCRPRIEVDFIQGFQCKRWLWKAFFSE